MSAWLLWLAAACSDSNGEGNKADVAADASAAEDAPGADGASSDGDTSASDGASAGDATGHSASDGVGDAASDANADDGGAGGGDDAGADAGEDPGADASADATADTGPPCEPSAGKVEVCNGVDDDCDGQTDEGAQICDDGNVCTIDEACTQSGDAWSCVGTPVDGPCDDNDVCTGGEACSGGVCTGGFVSACNDMNECTTDSCDSSGTGCTHEPIPGCGLPCTMGKGECPKPNYCDSLVPLTCSGAGRCTLKPDTCTGETKPVCACDNQTYNNACLAGQAGVPVQSIGACPK